MATGDKMYIADKGTLDSVKSAIGDKNDAASVGSVMAKLNGVLSDLSSIVNTWNSTRAGYVDNTNTKINEVNNKLSAMTQVGASREYFTPAQILTEKKFVIQTVSIPVSTGVPRIMSVTGPGILYAATMSYAGSDVSNNVTRSIVTVDGSTLLSKYIGGVNTSNTVGIITAPVIANYGEIKFHPQASQYNPVLAYNRINITVPVSATDVSTNAISYLPKPIRFENSIYVEGGTSNNAATFSLIYELD